MTIALHPTTLRNMVTHGEAQQPTQGDGSAEMQNLKKNEFNETVGKLIELLPPDLQVAFLGFARDVAYGMIADNTNINTVDPEKPEVKISPNATDFYKRRFDEITHSGILNRHVNPPLEIK